MFGDGTFAGTSANLVVCTDLAGCRDASDFGIEIVQTENGRRAHLDGVWDAGESAEITLHYTEDR